MERIEDAIERNRRRMWAVCYRMTGRTADADDLVQEAIARALERADRIASEDPTGWLLRMTANLCIDHARHAAIERRVNELVDPLAGAGDWPCGDPSPEDAATLREDLRFGIVVALQTLSPKQRAVLVLHDVCGRSLGEIATLLETNANAAKAVLHRSRVALAEARLHSDVDLRADRAIVERFAKAIEDGAIDVLTAMLAEDAWGVTDGGGIGGVATASKPNFGRRAIGRQWENAKRKLGQPVTTTLVELNGEVAIAIRIRAMPEVIVAIVHAETRRGEIAKLLVNRDPKRIAMARVP